jgi:hypothetical protein
MEKQNVKQIIQEFAIDFYTGYRDYVREIDSEIWVAKKYWDSRLDSEVDRDSQLGVTLTDYENWISEIKREHSSWWELGILNEDGSTITIESFDSLEEAEIYMAEHIKKYPDPYTEFIIDKWQMVNGNPKLVY